MKDRQPKMHKRIIYIVRFPFNQRDFDRFGIKIVIENGFEVEVWDLTRVLNSKLFENYIPPDVVKCKELQEFSSISQVVKKVAFLNNKEDFVVVLPSYSIDLIPILRALKRVSVNYAVVAAFGIPAFPPNDNNNNTLGYNKILNKIKGVTIRKLLNYSIRKVPYHFLRIKPVSIMLAGGAATNTCDYPISSKTETYWIHSLDYDHYLNVKENGKHIRNDYIVFIDSYYPFHPDYFGTGIPRPFSPEDYYPPLCSFFDLIETETKCRVVVASHPKAHYDKLPDYFNGREVIKGKTCELIKDCRFAITQESLAINYVVLFKKPVIFITSDLFNSTFLVRSLNAFAGWLNKIPINLDHITTVDLSKELEIDEDAYNNYSYHYIKIPGTPELPFWQVVADRLKSRLI